MNFNHLEYAVEVSRSGSISKAAEKLFLSQPYLSGMMKGLEEELGYKIFDRKKSGVALTRQGEDFIQSAKVILLEVRKIKELALEEEKQLNIACYYTTHIMERFLKFRNQSEVSLSDRIMEMGNMEVMDAVSEGKSSLGIVFFVSEKAGKYQQAAADLGLKMRELFSPMKVYAIMSNKHPMSSESVIEIADLKNHPYVSYEDSSSRLFLKFLEIEENDARLLKVSDRGSFYDALRSGEYFSVMAFRGAAEQEGMALIPIQGKKLQLSSCYVTGKNYKLTKREKEFLSFLQES